MRKLALIGTALAVAAGLSVSVARAETNEINFGVIATEASTNLKTIWEPYFAAMAKGTGLKINGYYASDYAGVIEAMRFKKVQAAWFGNKSAMEATNRSGGEIFAQSVDSDGNPGYWSHLIVNKDSPIKNLDDVLKCDKSIDFGIGDPNSTSGFLVPTSYIFAAKNIDPKQCFKTLRNASHEANAMAVAHKQLDVATNNSENLRRLEVTAPDARKDIRVIWTSPLIPSDPLVWRKDLEPGVKTKLYTWLMSYGRVGTPDDIADAKKVLAGLQWAPFKPSSNDQLLPIRILENNKAIMKIKGDSKLSDAEKAAQIEPLQAEIKQFQDAADKAEHGAFKQQVDAFVAADKAGDQAKLKTLIAEFAANVASTPSN
ncbi:phosphonate ABC transporter substrate-binding protein [Rhodopseudomonas sp. BAL398]|nr:phosphonate ABC transporter substrate-binding protein [Rhodopseudomonas sp. BAL398]MDF3812998.1 phosphonate ABC transporter substrate-binding protein [Rhodopseudomonas sp. BAL398]WOK15596.1 phosphonate ABC transporter substrate-binding protein [Rhodopseudomonas sp. BAL398]